MVGSILGKIGWDGKRLFEKSRMEVKDCHLRNCSQFCLRSRMRWIINCCVFIYNDDVSEALTPNSLLYGRKLEFENKSVDEGHFEVAEGNVNCGWENVRCKSWKFDGLREISCKKAGKGGSEIRVVDAMVIGEHTGGG